jgi:hypothetical protein
MKSFGISPHCVGAIDGKHTVLQSPFKNGGESCNYTGTFSLILLAAVDASHSFLFVSVGYQDGINGRLMFSQETVQQNFKFTTSKCYQGKKTYTIWFCVW